MSALPKPKGIRAEIQDALAVYRNPGINLGRLLCDVAMGGDYKEWGWDDFADYCWEELGLKKAKVRELMAAYNYLKANKPDLIKDAENGVSSALPSVATLAALSKAEQTEGISDEDLNEMKFQAFHSPITDDTEREIKRRSRPRKEEHPDEKQRREVRSAARKFRALVEKAEFVPDSARDKIGEGIAEIEALV